MPQLASGTGSFRKYAPYCRLWLLLAVFCCLLPPLAAAQTQVASAQFAQPRIAQAIDETNLVSLRGNTHPLARPQFDRGAAPPDLPMQRMLLVLKRSPEQEAALQQLLDAQQDKSSPSYRQWLTPDQFGQQFGPAEQDIQTVTSWLESHGFQVPRVAQGRTAIEFSGTAAQVQQAFHTEIHQYAANGESHWANSSDPQIPAALSPVIAGVNSLHSFTTRPMHQVVGLFSKSKATGQVRALNPLFTFPDTANCGTDCFAVGPYDFATIYDVLPLWNAQPPIDGTGQSIAVVGRSNINVQDVRDFRALFGLPANDPQIILDGPDPGLVPDDETESDLDVEWSSAVAKGATIKFVTSESTETQDGIELSALYVIDNNVAPVMSVSYGSCELFLGAAGNQLRNNLWEQASAQGITVVVSSGDSGSAGCDVDTRSQNVTAQYGLAVNGFASTPFNVAVGGTDFLNFGPGFNFRAASPYWNLTNNSNEASVKGYIPEIPWNDSCANPVFLTLGSDSTSEAACNDSQYNAYLVTIGGGGGASNCIASGGQTVASCSGRYGKPSWQTGPGVPLDNARDLPDVSLFASNGFLGSFYIVCEADQDPGDASCNLNSPYTDFVGVGGTSSSAPDFAGMMALVNQFNNPTGPSGLGNANYVLYKLPTLASQSGLSCNSNATRDSRCVFNDVTSGTITMPCAQGSPNCVLNTPSADYYLIGLLSGYNANTAYDLATGLGTVNAYNLVHDWALATFMPSATALSLNGGSAVNITHGQSVPVSVTVTSENGTPTGDVALVAAMTGSTSIGIDRFALNSGAASGSTSLLPGGTYTVKAHYEGDGTYGGSDSNAVAVTVGKESSETQLNIVTFGASGGAVTNSNATAVTYGSPYILRVGVTNAAGTPCSPNPLGESGCPTGAVALTDNGSPLDAGTYTLNSSGYLEDQHIQLGAGSHILQASYAGDSSFASSSATSPTITVAQAQTTTALNISDYPSVLIGASVTITATIKTTSNGLSPSGTVAFFTGSTLLGSVSVAPAKSNTGSAQSTATLITATLPYGMNQITAQYSGDANYTMSVSQYGVLDVLIPTTVTVTPSNSTLPQGMPVTFTAVIIPSQGGGPPVGGAGQFSASGFQYNRAFPNGASQPVINGQFQATTNESQPFFPTGSVTVTAQYYGDDNYADSTGTATASVTPQVGTDFSLSFSAPSITISAPSYSSSVETVTLTPLNGFSGTTSLACSISPAGSHAICTLFNPSMTGSGSSEVEVAASGPSSSGQFPAHNFGRFSWPLAGGVAALALILLLAFPLGQRRWSAALAFTILIFLATTFASCGGGSSSGVGSPITPTGVPYTVTITGVCGPLSHTASFTFTVQ